MLADGIRMQKVHKTGNTFSGFSRIFMELCGSKVQLASSHGNFIDDVANPEIVYCNATIINMACSIFQMDLVLTVTDRC